MKKIKTHPFIPFVYEKSDNFAWDATFYNNVEFTKDFGIIKKGSKWYAVEVRIDGEGRPHLYCRECENESDGKVVFVSFEILSVKEIESFTYLNDNKKIFATHNYSPYDD